MVNNTQLLYILCKYLTIFALCKVNICLANQIQKIESCCVQTPSRIAIKDHSITQTNMVLIKGGTFMMGGDNQQARSDEFPKHQVTLSSYSIDITQVTNAQFQQFIVESHYVTTAERSVDWEQLKLQLPPETPKPSTEDLMPASLVFIKQNNQVPLHDPTLWWKWTHGADWRHPHGPNSDIYSLSDHPVVHISWDDAAAYCAYYGKRLPTEAEWEFAARGGLENNIYPWGNETIDSGTARANIWHGEFPYYNERTESVYTTPVATYMPNKYGLYDMAGNVWEWVADWYDYDYYSTIRDGAINPKGPEQSNDPTEPLAPKKVIRGGSFLCNESYCSGYRVAARMRTSTDTSMEHLGFRCACDN